MLSRSGWREGGRKIGQIPRGSTRYSDPDGVEDIKEVELEIACDSETRRKSGTV